MKCFNCKRECGDHHFMCDLSESLDDVWCPECFGKTDCGKGEHGEGCPTSVTEISDSATLAQKGAR
jgi:hypothetical protein